MRKTSTIWMVVFLDLGSLPALGGGAACEFQANGLPLLKQSPVLVEILDSRFVVKNGGMKGPMDAPFKGRRLYTYMEFKALSKENAKEKYVIRIHFARKEKNLEFKSLEILPEKKERVSR